MKRKSKGVNTNSNNFTTEGGDLTKSEQSHTFKRTKFQITLSRLKRKIFKHVRFLRVISLLSIGILLFFITLLIRNLLITSGFSYYLNLFSDFVFAPESKIEAIDGVTNILVLGKGGYGHDAPDLTDTIIFASVSHKSGKVVLISLPRDIWIPELRAKLNSTYYWGNQKKFGGGLILAKSQVEEILGKPIQYAVVLDFSGFKKIIDVIGGVDVEVENLFVDNKYPIAGKEDDLCNGDKEFKCRYETVSFQKGKQHMGGELALKFVRSRNAQGDEGTDLAREARQQKVINALKDKILSKEILLSPQTLFILKDAIASSAETDMSASNVAILARRLYDSRQEIQSYVLPEDFLVNPPTSTTYDNLYVFIPKDKNWDKVKNWVKCVLDNAGGC